jgi:hypothetical protein
MMKKLVSFILLFAVRMSFGQTPAPELPKILPPSPDVSAITKDGQLALGMFTGTAQATIPIYEIKMKGFSIPITLNYSSNGLKVDEIPSKVGMNWNLSCNGVISRTVHGRPDDGIGIIRKPEPVSSNPPNPPSLEDRQAYFEEILSDNGHYDAEPDEFSVTAPGLSTKFILNDAGQVVQYPYSNIKIQVTGGLGNPLSGFKVTNTNGIVYDFGVIERTISNNISGTVKTHTNLRTAFYLSKITLPNGEYIDYSYTGFQVVTYPGVSESVSRGAQATGLPCSCDQSKQCPGPYVIAGSYNKNIIRTEYNCVALFTISASNGQTVRFDYETLSSGDGRISEITVNAGNFNRYYSLVYETPTTSPMGSPITGEGEFNPRFFLTEVNYKGSPAVNAEKLKYSLDYIDKNMLPTRLSCSQDYLGYFNGKGNSSLLPVMPGESQYWAPYGTADRSFDGSFAMKGMLQKITFPTGGFQSFTYEPNTYANWEEITDFRTVGEAGSGASNAQGTWMNVTHTSEIFKVHKNQLVHVQVSGETVANTPYAFISIDNITTGASESLNLSTSGSFDFDMTFEPGDYKISFRVRGEPNTVSVILTYDASEGPGPTYAWVNHESGGVRVKQITSYDPAANKSNDNYYFYAKKDELTKSSGIAHYPTSFSQPSFYRQGCGCEASNGTSSLKCETLVLSSNSTVPLYLFADNTTYEYVVESNDPIFKNGGIQHKFDYDMHESAEYVQGVPITTVPNKIITSTYSLETETEYFDKDLQPVKHVVNHYDMDANYQKDYVAKAFRKKYSYQPTGGDNPTIVLLEPYDQTNYTYSSLWLQPVSTITKDYANGIEMQQTITNHYKTYPSSDPLNTAPIKIETTNSKNETITTETTYPTDYPSTPLFQTMVSKNMLGAPVEVTQKKGSTQLAYTKTEYKEWYNSTSGVVIEPEIVKVRKGLLAEEPRIHFYSYNTKGNPLEVSKERDIHMAYVWGYDNRFPVAEVKNARVVDIAHTSFEADETSSGWSGIDPASITTTGSGITGKKYYNKNNFSLTANLPGSFYYIISYWSKNGAYNVSGAEGAPRQLQTTIINGSTWTLYEHKVLGGPEFTQPASVTGSGSIDELRLFPENAQMVTYTYAPYVGATSQCDINNRITYFEYDEFGRLSVVRDKDMNVAKKYCYNFWGQPEICASGTAPLWTANGESRCQPCPVNNTYISGRKELKEIDINPNSPGYNSIRWVDAGVDGNCVVQANFQTDNLACQQTNGENTGNQIVTTKDVNPCSPTFGQTQQNIIQNTTACPLVCTLNNCSGKCINGVCDLGTLITIAAVRFKDEDNIFKWRCTRVLCFSDGTMSAESEDISLTSCDVTICQ